MFNKLMNMFSVGEFSRNIFVLLTGSILSQAIPIAVSPIITRLYSPKEFGVFALYVSIFSIISVVATARYELAIMLPDNEEDAVNLFGLSIVIASIISLISLVIVMLFHSKIVGLLNEPDISSLLYFIPLSILCTGVYQALTYWANRRKQYKRMTASKINQSGLTALCNLLFGSTGVKFSGLIGSLIIGQLLATGIFARQLWKEDHPYKNLLNKEQMIKNAKKYKDFPKINSFHAFLDMIKENGVVFIIASIFGSTILGYYSFTMRMLKLPAGLISSSVSQVIYQKSTEIYNSNGDLQIFIRKTMILLALFGTPVFLIIILFAPMLFEWTFGESWREAGVYAQLISPWMLANFVVSPTSHIPIILNRQKTAFYLSVTFNLFVLVIFFIISKVVQHIYIGLAIMGGMGFLYTLVYGFWIVNLAKNKKMGKSVESI
ncbi:oligosaccharide flippase family protein [Bacillus sp. FJAT-29790]|uniref:lipopolysaccharide biosynthesis protein n=1 Tax=Bacillus sp. FJAT-29790 TaxID=1895002 RepID=UPI001C21A246|nr:oligosaccharide flippase family protein [Bacillus sp. FJAT-29790]MBU8880791.1 oligosaccharide flippase family protein [Bacillus sp. FJAT-29790]